MTACAVIADSVSPDGKRLTTFVGQMHRYVLSEFNTHRSFSRNSASSRAVPFKTQVARITTNLAEPYQLAYNQAGMQAAELLSDEDAERAYAIWREAADNAVRAAQQLADLNVHKQWVNRLLEPFMWHTVVFTSDPAGLENFFAQRCTKFSPLAQPEMGEFADRVHDAYVASVPKEIRSGEWHTPFVSPHDSGLTVADRIAVSVARCARVSYLSHDGSQDPQKDIDLFRKLVTAHPPHLSPLEHVATPSSEPTPGNFDGWLQYRHAYDSEAIRADLQEVIKKLAS